MLYINRRRVVFGIRRTFNGEILFVCLFVCFRHRSRTSDEAKESNSIRSARNATVVYNSNNNHGVSSSSTRVFKTKRGVAPAHLKRQFYCSDAVEMMSRSSAVFKTPLAHYVSVKKIDFFFSSLDSTYPKQCQ